MARPHTFLHGRNRGDPGPGQWGEHHHYSKDGDLNAAAKGKAEVVLEVNGGEITVVMASGDTDAFTSNGDLDSRGGTITITARSAFDADGTARMTGGKVTVNGAW